MGTVLIGRDAPAFEGGVAHIWVETPAPADAPARRLAEVRVEGVAHRAGEAHAIAFTIDDVSIFVPAGARLRAWIDVAGRGEPGPDDLYSTEATMVTSGPCELRVERSGP